ncbi:AraC family transcriptional regulator [Tsuneonella sp. CC-YZS046]|uniref:helix-turn-helix domain-containing protein n=1 Tax=Tsuneonella sp. CC-YZS046 TaxID=3042152 RepID=UPI002D79D96E|nr:AraC family transcriptional regulator [Tsuneonella sp. CC-YZS046]WRO65501.1 AraC family transcriptional regulator [Tsuneonella sp. CC-YZS046]
MPDDPRLLRVCGSLLERPSDPRDIDEWARIAGMGRRTFTRAFRRETGIGFAMWRQQARLMEAMALLSSGTPIAQVAFEVGYDSPSSFSAMFRRAFGVSPSQYLR